MHTSHSAGTRRPSRRLLVSLASTALLASGCSSLISTAPSSGVVSSAASLSGRVHGGNQPVAGATVNLYFAGQTGVAKPGQAGVSTSATLAATTKTLDDGAGSFNFIKSATDGQPNPGNTNTFSCPTGSGTPYVYLVARGGNTLNTHDPTVSNTASVFIAPVALCTSITAATFTYMSEAVTAATVAAVHQFMDEPTGDISSDSILASYDALANAFNTVSTMVSLSTGQTIASVTLTGPATGVTVTASPEQAKLNHIANILSACINNPSASTTACGTLFTNAVPPARTSTTSTTRTTFTAATDVLQAAYYMFTNATDTNQTNLTQLYNLSPGSGAPYQPTLTAVPSDWSIGIQYASSGNCSGSTGSIISFAYDLNVDGDGNLWIANGTTGSGTLAELSSTGIPLTCVPIPGGSRGGTIDSGVLTGTPTPTSRTASNIWIGDSQNNNVYRYTPGTTPALLPFPTSTLPFAMAADGNGNVYYTTVTTGSPSVWKIPGAAGATAAITPVEISTSVGSAPSRILVDGNGAIWVSSQNNFVSQLTPSTAAGNLNGYITTQFTTSTPSYGLAANAGVGSPNGIYVSIQGPVNQLDLFTGTGITYARSGTFPTATNAGGLNVPSSIAVDGASNVWAANDQTIDGTNTGLSVASEFSATGASLSPDGVLTGGYQKPTSFFQHGRSIAIDQAGNVWIGKDGSNSVTKIVGGGVPIYQPFALGLANGRFQTIP